MGEYTALCEKRGRAAPGKGCTDRSKFPKGVAHCALSNMRGTCSAGTVDVDTLAGAYPAT